MCPLLLLPATGVAQQLRPQQHIVVTLVDSVPLANDLRPGFLSRVVVRRGSAVDTVPNVLTSGMPAIVGDTVLIGVASDPTDKSRIYRYSVSSGRVGLLALPSDLVVGLTGVAFAPDGRAMAYVRFPRDETGIGVVRSWPAGKVLALTDPVPVPVGDVVGGGARWRDAQHYEIFIESVGYGWLRFRGALNQAGFTVDTLGTTLPNN